MIAILLGVVATCAIVLVLMIFGLAVFAAAAACRWLLSCWHNATTVIDQTRDEAVLRAIREAGYRAWTDHETDALTLGMPEDPDDFLRKLKMPPPEGPGQ